MRSTISTIAAVAAGLFASTVSAQGQVAIYWGQGSYQRELSVVCEDPSVDIVNIAFVNGFPTTRNKYPDTNFGNACGDYTFPNPDGTPSKFLGNCPLINKGIKTCKQNGKKVLLSLGGGYPTSYYLANPGAALWLARVLIEGFGPKVAGSTMPRPFGDDVAVDGFDLDIESSTAVGDQKFQYYGDFVKIVKQLAPNMLISSAPQCVVPDAHLDKAITEAPFDYVFVQFYNTDACSAAQGLKELKDKQGSAFTWKAWSQKLLASANPQAKLFLGLPAGTNGANPNHYLSQTEANTLITELKKTTNFGGVMLWEATVSQNNTKFGQPYSQWIKYSIQGTFADNYHPVVSSSTLVSSTRSSTSVITPSSTPASSKPTSSKASSTALPTSSKVSSATPSKSSTPIISSSSIPQSSKSSSVVLSSSSTVKSSSSTVEPSSSTIKTSSTPVVTSSTVYPTSSSATLESSSSVHYSDTFSTASIPYVESSLSYSNYFSTALPSSYSASSSVEPSTVYPDHVSSTVVSSSSAYVTSSASSVYVPSSVEVSSSASSSVSSYYETSSVEASSVYETSSVPEVTSSASSVYETSSVPEITSSASSVYETSSVPEVTSSVSSAYETSSVPEVTSSASEYSSAVSSSYETSSIPEVTSSASENSSVYSASSSKSEYEASSTTPADASSTPCTTSTESYKTPEASSSASEYGSYSASSKTPEASSSYPVTESTKTPEASTGYYSASSTELYPTSSKTPEVSSATEYSYYSYYSESSKVPEASSKASEYSTVSTKTPEASSSATYEIYSSSVPASSAKSTEYIIVSPTPVESTKTPEASSASEYDVYSTASPTVTKPAESTTTVVTTTYLDTCSTGLTTKTTVITKTVCTACAKPSDKPEAEYPEDWTTSIYVSKTLTVTITKPIHPATDVPAYPTAGLSSAAPKPSAPAVEYPVNKEEVSYPTPAKSSSSVPSYPEVPIGSHKPSSSAPAMHPTASVSASKPIYVSDATVTVSQYITLTKIATPVAYTPVAYATPIAHQGYPVGNGNGNGNGTVPAGTGAVKPSATGGSYYPVKPSASSYTPPEFTGAGSKMSIGMTGFVGVVALLIL